MDSVAVSKLGKTDLVFVQSGAKINSVYYCENVLEQKILDIRHAFMFFYSRIDVFTTMVQTSMFNCRGGYAVVPCTADFLVFFTLVFNVDLISIASLTKMHIVAFIRSEEVLLRRC